ncbi:serine/arginine repetitive matrix protein 2-like [Drosophila miranda]|uniref:serine/arginine repetitive matrix protein 2-like n=1 Tax=Drosophila miranda TaxID=7229 RepID=UPI00143F71D9|nr:serine/arginine repetitive matrix protein 2-like [Drosophila miranda]
MRSVNLDNMPSTIRAATTDRPRDLLLIQQAKPAGSNNSSNNNNNRASPGGSHTYIDADAATAAAVASLRSKVPSISIIPLPVSTTIVTRSGPATQTTQPPQLTHARSTSKKATATSPPLAFLSDAGGSGTAATPALAILQRPQQQHQYQQTDKCTVLKLDMHSIEQQLSELEAADEEEENMANLLGSTPPAQILANQPIIVKIEPTQAFHIVDEGDTRVLSLPLSDADKLGASWIDLKDITGLQAGSGAALLDVCFEQTNEDGTIIATEPPDPKRVARQQPARTQLKYMSEPPALARSSSFSSLSSFSSISNISSVCKTMTSNTSESTISNPVIISYQHPKGRNRPKEGTPPPMSLLIAQKPAATTAQGTSATSARESHGSSSSTSSNAMTDDTPLPSNMLSARTWPWLKVRSKSIHMTGQAILYIKVFKLTT